LGSARVALDLAAQRGARRRGLEVAGATPISWQPGNHGREGKTQMSSSTTTVEAPASLVKVTHLVYALHALGLAIGAFGAASVLGSFLFGWPSIIAVIINYAKRSEVRGTWLESHFNWQIRTFWFALAWALIVGLVSLPLTVVLIGIGTWVAGLFLLGVWAIYRIARGWMRLNAHREMPLA
jgi:uncharacterized membrane protein